MSTTNGAPAPAKGSPMLLVLFAVVLAPTFLIGYAVGAGSASVVGGFVAMYSLIAFLGGPLRADLRLAAALSPLLLFAAIVPRLLGEVSRPAAIGVIVVIVFVAALLPLRGPRFVTVGLGLGMVTLFAYGMALIGPAGPWQVVIAAVTGVATAVVLRVLLGIGDPSKATREKIADVLDADVPALTTAFDTWLADGRRRWLGIALGAASHYRLALHSAEAVQRAQQAEAADGELVALRTRAHELAERLRTKKPGPAPQAGAGEVTIGFGTEASAALDAVERAITERDTSRVSPADRLRTSVLRPSVRLRSIQVRHAVRTAFGLLLILVITSYLPAGDPLVATALLTTFGILQASWRETLNKARPRVIGLVGGAALAVVIILVVPAPYLPVVALTALVVALWNMMSRPAVAYTFMVVVTVGFNTSLRHTDPVHTLVEYAVLTLIAALIGVLVGFAVVPGLRPEPLRQRIVAARAKTEQALRAMTGPDRAEALALHRAAAQARAELTPDREQLDDDQLAELDRFRAALRDLSMLGTTAALGRTSDTERLRAALDEAPAPADGETPAGLESIVAGLADQVRTSEAQLLAALPDR
ncbi:Fusaric acid resistance protein family protein [Saccharopolyspora kobensis]|uniref:Fusaric acid resistance protein family protein n=2 Tax=Saccharopolyspora kobensis TaxID=146035 RepID=A0A1H5ZYV0_9PSEU|nr:FUSC family protein [Saccharopolyspora kobensis]SEG41639.1 Fusaric acid resistance protein family protein [Saccharopolyspora kobensis]SFE16636.1 Fusaric acid resistance protein family protein [Saccharopolyspora kobensis]